MSTADKLPTLYELSRDLADALEAEEFDPAIFNAMIPQIEAKVVGTGRWLQYVEDLIGAITERERKVSEARKALEAKRERAKRYLLECMELAGIAKVTDERTGMVVSVRANPPQVAVDVRVEDLPEEFVRVPEPPEPEADKRALAVALKSGRAVYGCRLVSSSRLVVK